MQLEGQHGLEKTKRPCIIDNKLAERCLVSGPTKRTEDINVDVFLESFEFGIYNIDVVVSDACIGNNLFQYLMPVLSGSNPPVWP
jgi:hypothetical protein